MKLIVHAHGKGFVRAVEAIKACGIEPQVAVPGLVQAGPDGRAALLKQVSSLGFTLVTDHGVRQAWAYEGFAAPRRMRSHGDGTHGTTDRLGIDFQTRSACGLSTAND